MKELGATGRTFDVRGVFMISRKSVDKFGNLLPNHVTKVFTHVPVSCVSCSICALYRGSFVERLSCCSGLEMRSYPLLLLL